jgi:hypothetical protein
LLGTGVVLYIVVFVVFGRTDVSWIMPDTQQIARTIVDVWPRMPFFVQQENTPDGQVTYYTVPTRQLTRQEMRQLGMTNAVAAPKNPR